MPLRVTAANTAAFASLALAHTAATFFLATQAAHDLAGAWPVLQALVSELLIYQFLAVALGLLSAWEGWGRYDMRRVRKELRSFADALLGRTVADATDAEDGPSMSVHGAFPPLALTATLVGRKLGRREAASWLILHGILSLTGAACVPLVLIDWPLLAVACGALVIAGQCAALTGVYLALRDAEKNVELARLNRELRAAQERLAESARTNERLRIARELHDVLGHHLTALTLNLEVASHLADGRAAPHVDTAQTLARLLLTKVREVVGALREDGAVDLASALRALAEDVPLPAVHFELPEALAALDQPEATRTLLRCVQEIVTNAVRHAHARNLWVTIESNAAGVVVHAHDDGRGAFEPRVGNGLRGMQERLAQFGGRLELASRPGEGFAVKAVLPLAGGRA